MFGESIEINATDARNYNLVVYSQRFEGSFDYDYADIAATFRNYRLPICAGKDVHGALQTYDMAEFPHLLIAGETGAGKSTQLRAILTSLIQSRKPIDFYLADMKRSEFHLFRRVDRVKEVVTDAGALALILRRISAELDSRGKLLDDHELTHIDEFNALKTQGRRNYIVVAVDEVALLKKERAVMETLEEISAIGRALGVFLILSMQRPDADVLDGKLKNNLTVRMAFKQADKINSRITLGKAGAEELTEKGRMLIKREQITEVQAPFLALDRAKEILAEFKAEEAGSRAGGHSAITYRRRSGRNRRPYLRTARRHIIGKDRLTCEHATVRLSNHFASSACSRGIRLRLSISEG